MRTVNNNAHLSSSPCSCLLPLVDAVAQAHTAFQQEGRQRQSNESSSSSAQFYSNVLFAYAHVLDYACSGSGLHLSELSSAQLERLFAPCAFIIEFGAHERGNAVLIGLIEDISSRNPTSAEIKSVGTMVFALFFITRSVLMAAHVASRLPSASSGPMKTLISTTLKRENLHPMMHEACRIVDQSVTGKQFLSKKE